MPCFLLLVIDRKSTRLNSSHLGISYAVFCLKKKIQKTVSSERKRCSPPPCSASLMFCPTLIFTSSAARRATTVSIFVFFLNEPEPPDTPPLPQPAPLRT